MKSRMLPILGLFAGALPGLAMALGKIQVENAKVGEKTLYLTVDDSILPPDLGKLRIEGYDIEQAVFVEEDEDIPFVLQPAFVDMTAPGGGRIVEYSAASGLLVLEWPAGRVPQVGAVLGDTAFGGLLRKVTKVEAHPQGGEGGKRWILGTVEADLADAVQSGGFTFSTRLDLNQVLPDLDHVDEAAGFLPDGTPNYAQTEYGLAGTRILFQPTVTGRMRILGGKVEDFSLRVQGDCEVIADARGAFHGRGDFEYEDELPARPAQIVPLGNGLFLRVQSRPSIRMEASSAGEALSVRAGFRITNSLQGDLVYARGQWRPMAENRMTQSGQAVKELQGEGTLRLAIKPRMEFLMAGVQGAAFTFEPFARFTSAPDAKARGTADEAPAAVPGVESLRPQPADGRLLGLGSKELSLGANIFMEARTTFTGPPLVRSFTLFSREQSVFSPPRDGSLSVKDADSGRVWLFPQTFPRSDRYIIQMRVGGGPWETLADAQTASDRLRIGHLRPATTYRFRALGVNAMGVGPAFPPEGVAFTTPAVNRPPFIPAALFPEADAGFVQGSLQLAWRGGDPDPGSRVQYTVYLDTRNPPAAVRASGLADTTLALSGLRPGTTYYWKVAASDGRDVSEGPVRAFTVRGAGQSVKPEAANAMITLPRGGFRREDGREVTVGPFQIGRYEVSQAEFGRVMGRNPSYHLQDSLPVERVTWEEAESYCRESGGRLPTEAEWEYAARAGSTGDYYWGHGDAAEYAWFRENSQDRSQKVGRKKPNAWGLYDMAGNVFEWVSDWYAEYVPDDVDHPRGPDAGTAKVIRGASWYSEAGNLGLGTRYSNRPAFRNFKVGFRCAKDAETAPAAPVQAPVGRIQEAADKPEPASTASPSGAFAPPGASAPSGAFAQPGAFAPSGASAASSASLGNASPIATGGATSPAPAGPSAPMVVPLSNTSPAAPPAPAAGM